MRAGRAGPEELKATRGTSTGASTGNAKLGAQSTRKSARGLVDESIIMNKSREGSCRDREADVERDVCTGGRGGHGA